MANSVMYLSVLLLSVLSERVTAAAAVAVAAVAAVNSKVNDVTRGSIVLSLFPLV